MGRARQDGAENDKGRRRGRQVTMAEDDEGRRQRTTRYAGARDGNRCAGAGAGTRGQGQRCRRGGGHERAGQGQKYQRGGGHGQGRRWAASQTGSGTDSMTRSKHKCRIYLWGPSQRYIRPIHISTKQNRQRKKSSPGLATVPLVWNQRHVLNKT